MLCLVSSKDSVPGAHFSRPSHRVLGLFAALVFLVVQGFVTNTSQADDISDRVQVDFEKVTGEWKKRKYQGTVVVTNTSLTELKSPLRLIITDFKNQRHSLNNATGITGEGYPYIDIDLPGGSLEGL